MLRYSNETLFGTMTTYPGWWVWNTEKVKSPDQFNKDLRTLLDNLNVQAASGGSLHKVAIGNITAPDFQTIYALVQCTPDLSLVDCQKCLYNAASDLPRCCNAKTGAQVLFSSCYLLYDVKIFYNQSRLDELVRVPPPPQPVQVPSPPVTTPPQPVPVPSPPVTTPPRPVPAPSPSPEDINVVESLHYDFDKIRAATNDFSENNKLGQGGFGPVYKGKLLSGQEMAVKRLSRNSGQGDIEFKNEVMLLAKLQHRNLVRLLGFSIGGKEKILIYEFVENASLDHFIFGSTKHSNLNWQERYKIIKGITRGLLYLHEDSRLRIIHRDLKASNILLDGDMNPKIADFGMARLVLTDETQANTTRIVGTYGYMAPEYAMHGQFSVKSDVFSFGVIVLEIISGQKSYYFQSGQNPKGLLSSAWKNWHEGTEANLIDPMMRGDLGILQDILRCIHIALLCVQENAADRPTMALVIQMLNSFSITLPVPLEPTFCVPAGYGTEIQEFNAREGDSNTFAESEVANSYQNDVSNTDLYPR
ncbi:hypothetical protein RD792_007727 [Penstemon davidsonii]|uniref:Uncharacterized protein n=1 Tax=Penstemon davidsonii TaxID=160366 RepID=A0ABR0D7C1_9LAMI|nr:hypothetical protein RD792_007727 [Penstemon davidsonii]